MLHQKCLLFLSITLFFALNCSAATYNFNTEGSYTNAGNWDVYPGTSISATDTIVLHTLCTIDAGVTINLSGIMQMGPCLSSDLKPITVHGTINVSIGAYIKQGCTTFYLDCSATSVIINAYFIELPITSSGLITGSGDYNTLNCDNCTIEPGGSGIVGVLFFTQMDLQDPTIVLDFATYNSHDWIECTGYASSAGTATLELKLIGNYLPGSSADGLWTHSILHANFSSFGPITVEKPGTTPKVHFEPLVFNGLIQIRQFKEYNFNGAINNSYLEVNNWDTSGRFAGDPGWYTNSHEDVFTSADCLIPANEEVSLNGGLICNGNLTNSGKLTLSPLEGIILGLKNYGNLNLYGHLTIDSAFINYGELLSGSSARTTLVDYSYNYGKIKLQGNAFMETLVTFKTYDTIQVIDNANFVHHALVQNRGYLFVDQNAVVGKDSQTYVLNNLAPNGIVENHGELKLTVYNGNMVTGSGLFTGLLGPGKYSPGPGITAFNTKRYIPTEGGNLFLEIEDDNNYDQMIITTNNENNLIDETITIDLSDYQVNSTDCIEFEIIKHQNAPVNIDSVSVINLGPHDWELISSDSNIVFKLIPGEPENNALDFNGSTDNSFIHVPHDLGSIHTIEFLFFPNKIIPGNSGDNLFSMNASATQYIWTMGTSSALPDETMTVLNSGAMYIQYPFKREWYHVAIVSNGSTYHEVYINGVLEPSYVGPSGVYPTVYNMNDFQIGARKPYPQGYTQGFFNGRMDEIRLWSTIRTISEIAGNINNELSTADTVGLEAYYKMNQGIAYADNICQNQLKDFSANTRSGTLYNFAMTGDRSNWIRSRHCMSNFHQTNEFTEDGDGVDWFDGANWSLNRTPNVCDEVIIGAGKDVNISAPGAQCFTIDVRGELFNDLGNTLEMVAPFD